MLYAPLESPDFTGSPSLNGEPIATEADLARLRAHLQRIQPDMIRELFFSGAETPTPGTAATSVTGLPTKIANFVGIRRFKGANLAAGVDAFDGTTFTFEGGDNAIPYVIASQSHACQATIGTTIYAPVLDAMTVPKTASVAVVPTLAVANGTIKLTATFNLKIGAASALPGLTWGQVLAALDAKQAGWGAAAGSDVFPVCLSVLAVRE